MSDNEQLIASKVFPSFKDVNFGVILMAGYIIIDFGSLAGMYTILNYTLRIPFLISAISLLYAMFLIFSGKVVFSQATKYMFLLCFYIVISSFLKTEPTNEKYSVIKVFLYYFSNFIILTTCIKRISQLIIIIDVWLASTLFSCYHGIMQGGLVWGNPWIRDENEMALFATISIPFALTLFSIHKNKFKKMCYLASIGASVTVSVISHSRGGMLSLGLVFLLYWFLLKNKLRNFLLILTTITLMFVYAPPIYFKEMSTISQGAQEATARDRVYLWGYAVDMFIDYPIFGIGPSNYPYFFSSYEKGNRYEYGAYRVPHSTPVQWMAELGLVGIALLIFLIYSLYNNWSIFRIQKYRENFADGQINTTIFVNLAYACAIAQAGFWCGSLFLSLMSYPFIWLLIPLSEIIRKQFANKSISEHKTN